METRKCQNCRQDFTIEPQDFAFYEKVQVPPPTFCPECREQRRIAFRNERSLYKRKCDLCGEFVVSRISPDKPYVMYCRKCWWSDSWNPFSYGFEFDFSVPFFEQYNNLLHKTPHVSLLSSNTINSDWVNQETDDKNCYLNVGGHFNEDSAYTTYAIHSKSVFDNYWIINSEFCYESINCSRCYKVFYSHDCHNCRDTILSIDCKNCSNCFGCAGLRNKQYCLWNKQKSKEEYESFIKDCGISSHKRLPELIEKASSIWLTAPRRYASIALSWNATGNYISQSKNVRSCFGMDELEDGAYIYIGGWAKDSYDLTSVGYGERMYEGSSSVGLANSKFFAFCLGGGRAEVIASMELEYCYAVFASKNCFGCANIRNKQYCILNKQYTKEEYELLIPRIKRQMQDVPYLDKIGRVYSYGEFFPSELSLFGYNETAANDHYPLSREKALELSFNWSDYQPEVRHAFSDYDVPDDIRDVKDDVLEQTLRCDTTGRSYRIIPMELEFYRTNNIPIPKKHPLARHSERFKKILPWKLYTRYCECGTGKNDYINTAVHEHADSPCGKEIQTPYSNNRKELVYCEVCYQKEIQ